MSLKIKTAPYYKSLIKFINKKYWWRTAINIEAIEERGLFLSSSFSEAEFYGRPLDIPFRVNVNNPLIGDEKTILRILNLVPLDEDCSLKERFDQDKQIKNRALKLGYDSIALFSPNAYSKLLNEGIKPRSIELNVLNINLVSHNGKHI